MYRRNWNMDPRGRNSGHGGIRPGLIPGIIGLVFFGWIIIAAIGGLLGGVFMVLASVLHSLARILPHVLTRVVTSRSIAVGTVIGLIWYFRTHGRKAEAGKRAEKTRESGGAVDGTAVETEVIETPVYRSFGA